MSKIVSKRNSVVQATVFPSALFLILGTKKSWC